MSEEFTYAEVQKHSTKKDLYLVIHDKVYNTSSFVDEHPGGEEVLLDVGVKTQPKPLKMLVTPMKPARSLMACWSAS